MNILVDLLGDFFTSLFTPEIAPDTPRGWLYLSLIYGAIVGGILAYTLFDAPSKADTATFLALLGGPLGMLFSAIHAVREPYDRLLCLCTFAVNTAAVALALFLYA